MYLPKGTSGGFRRSRAAASSSHSNNAYGGYRTKILFLLIVVFFCAFLLSVRTIHIQRTPIQAYLKSAKSEMSVKLDHAVEKLKNETAINSTIVDKQGIKVAYVTYSYLGNFSHFDNTILGSIKTWLPPNEKYYVVLNHKWRESFENYKIQRVEMDSTNSMYIDRIQPIFVDCPEALFGESPCCKQQEGLIEFYNKYFHQCNNANENDKSSCSYDWVVYMDDDMYFEHGVFLSLAKAVPYGIREQTEYLNNVNKTNPILFTASNYNPQRLGKSGYIFDRSPYNCSKDVQYRYPWGQPAIYNQAALELILPGLKAKGLVKQCMEFGVTHDVGNAIFHWMYSIPSVGVRCVNLKLRKRLKSSFRDDIVAFHAAGKKFPMEQIHLSRNPFGEWPVDMSNLPGSEYFGWWNVTGFKQTETYRAFGDPSKWGEDEWHTMQVSNCEGRPS